MKIWPAATLFVLACAACGAPASAPSSPTPAPTAAPVMPDCSLPFAGPLDKGGLNGNASITGIDGHLANGGASIGAFAAGDNSRPVATDTTTPAGAFHFILSPGLYGIAVVKDGKPYGEQMAQVGQACTTTVNLVVVYTPAPTPTPAPPTPTPIVVAP